MRNDHLTRRSFVRSLAIAAPASSLVMMNPAVAEDLPKLSTDDPLAVGLQYVEDAATATSPVYKAGSNCANCLQIQGNEGDAYRPCAIIPGKLVASAGWCSAWVAKP